MDSHKLLPQKNKTRSSRTLMKKSRDTPESSRDLLIKTETYLAVLQMGIWVLYRTQSQVFCVFDYIEQLL